MQVTRYNTGFKTVATIADRDLIPKFDGIKVTVNDASGDPNIGSGAAEYQWLEFANDWQVTWSQIEKTIAIAYEEKVIADGKVVADHEPIQGRVWGLQILEAGVIIGEGVPTVVGMDIDVGAAFNGKNARYFYMYQTSGASLSAMTTQLTVGFEAIAADNNATATYVDEVFA